MSRLIRPYDLLLDAATGWRTLETMDTTVVDGRISLQTEERLRPELTEPHGTFGGHALPRGVAIWNDEMFITDPPRHRILNWRPCCGSARPLATVGGLGKDPRQFNTPLGLAISHRDDLVVVDSENHRLSLFTLPGLALRRILGPFPARGASAGISEPEPDEEQPDPCVLPEPAPDELPALWRPVDVASGPDDTLYVADANGFIWRLDAQGRPDPSYSGQLPEGTIPRRLLVDRQHRVYVIGEDVQDVLILDRYGHPVPMLDQLEQRVRDWLLLHIPELAEEEARGPTFEEEAQARAALLPSELSRLMDVELNQFIANELRRQPGKTKDDIWIEHRDEAYNTILPEVYAALLPRFLRDVLPQSRLSLEGDRVLLAPSDSRECQRELQPTDLTVDEAGHLRLVDVPIGPYLLNRPPVATFRPSGFYRTQPLDSGRVGNPWHRIVLELNAPERTGVRLFSFTSDVLRPDLGTSGLLAEPPRLGPWQAAPDNADEWLIQSPPGRYLYLALVLKGPGDRTPTVERIYIYAHRQSSLRYLPAVYQADETSRHLLDRLLSLFDTVFGEIESEIEDFPLRLDADGAPADFLPWLASWFDLTLGQSRSEAQRRAFLKNIVTLYHWRGTVRGLRLLLQLHANLREPMPQIVEHHRGAGDPALETWLGEPPEGDAPHHFSVLLPAYTIDTSEKRAIVERLIDATKPAHTHYTLRPVHPGLRLGSDTACGAALGLDSLLGSHTAWRLPTDTERDGILGARTVLPSTPMPRAVAVRLGHTRLGAPQVGCRTCPPCEEP